MTKFTFKDFLALVGGSVITFVVLFTYLHVLEYFGI
jgi:hypothetical protein